MGIDLLEIYMELADHFGIEEETLVQQDAVTVQDLVNKIMTTLTAQQSQTPAELPSRSEVQSTLITIITRVTGHPESEILPDTRLIDLCD
ncbi:MAG: hypothetical protein ACIAZJ_27815 [Gimesia chilikensis]|uniref:hypothetical protein n=1 Tax=Gimesia chilikensis TaxID=2605989 RepID=UPI0037A86902